MADSKQGGRQDINRGQLGTFTSDALDVGDEAQFLKDFAELIKKTASTETYAAGVAKRQNKGQVKNLMENQASAHTPAILFSQNFQVSNL